MGSSRDGSRRWWPGRAVVALCVCVSGLAFVGTAGAGNAPDQQRTPQSVRDDAVTFRQKFGLPADDSSLEAARTATEPLALQRYGVALTAAEYAEQSARDARADAAGPLARLVAERRDELGGLWIDQQQGGAFVVMATPSMTPLTRAAVLASAPAGATVRFDTAVHSTATLDAAAALITTAMVDSTDPAGPSPGNPVVHLKERGLALSLAGVDPRRNGVFVGVDGLNEASSARLIETWDAAAAQGVLPHRSLVHFGPLAVMRPLDSRADSPGTMKGGLEITTPSTGGLVWACTSNVQVTGRLLLTAGHCFNPNEPISHAKMPIGSVTWDGGYYNGTTADVQGIQLNTRGLVSPDIFAAFGCNGSPVETCQQIDRANSVRNPVLAGDRVCGSGRTTYFVTCGVVILASASGTVLAGRRPGITTTDQAVTDVPLSHGDSGGIMGNGSVMFGIVSAGSNGTSTFSKLHNALALLTNRSMITTRQWVTLQSVYADKCADVANNNSANGTTIWSWACDGNLAQQWMIVPTGTMNGGYVLWYELRRYSPSTKCMDLDISAGGSADGTKIQEWDCNGGSNQRWRFIRQDTDQYRALQVLSMRSDKCVDLKINTPGGGYENGAPLQQYLCLGPSQRNQFWRVG